MEPRLCCRAFLLAGRLWTAISKALFAEFLATGLYVFFGVGSVLPWPVAIPSVLQIAITFNLATATAVQISWKTSGAHANPAVTLAYLVGSHISLPRAVAYIAAQLAGATVGAALLYGVTPGGVRETLGVNVVGAKRPGDDAGDRARETESGGKGGSPDRSQGGVEGSDKVATLSLAAPSRSLGSRGIDLRTHLGRAGMEQGGERVRRVRHLKAGTGWGWDRGREGTLPTLFTAQAQCSVCVLPPLPSPGSLGPASLPQSPLFLLPRLPAGLLHLSSSFLVPYFRVPLNHRPPSMAD